MQKYILLFLVLILFACGKEGAKEQKQREEFSDLSMCFSLAKGWSKAENGPGKSATFAGVTIRPQKSYFHSGGSIMTLSALGSRDNADILPVAAFADSVQYYLETKGQVEKKSYKAGGYDVLQLNLKESDKYVFKLLFTSSYTTNFMMDFIVPLSEYKKETFQSVGEIVASVRMKE